VTFFEYRLKIALLSKSYRDVVRSLRFSELRLPPNEEAFLELAASELLVLVDQIDIENIRVVRDQLYQSEFWRIDLDPYNPAPPEYNRGIKTIVEKGVCLYRYGSSLEVIYF
jgi:hypothetical protein